MGWFYCLTYKPSSWTSDSFIFIACKTTRKAAAARLIDSSSERLFQMCRRQERRAGLWTVWPQPQDCCLGRNGRLEQSLMWSRSRTSRISKLWHPFRWGGQQRAASPLTWAKPPPSQKGRFTAVTRWRRRNIVIRENSATRSSIWALARTKMRWVWH